jgi:3-oxoacyl-[acyl-carrier protein] reductase
MTALRGKIVCVTGAAGGIASAIVTQLAREGSQLALLDRDETRLSQLAEGVRSKFVVPVSCAVSDLATEGGVKSGLAEALAPFDGCIDILIANVGKLVAGRFEELPNQAWQASFALNFFSHVWAIQCVLPAMKRQGRGRILLVGSDQGRQPDVGLTAYASAKAAIHALTKALARELAPTILVNAVAPGMTRTALVEELMQGYAREFGTERAEAERREMARRGIPLGRLGEPEEVAQAALFFLQNDFTTGSILDISGGNVRCL